MNSCQTFDVEIDGITESAKLIDIISLKNERYAIYTVLKDDGLCDIYSSKVINTEAGDILVAYNDSEVKQYILDMIEKSI